MNSSCSWTYSVVNPWWSMGKIFVIFGDHEARGSIKSIGLCSHVRCLQFIAPEDVPSLVESQSQRSEWEFRGSRCSPLMQSNLLANQEEFQDRWDFEQLPIQSCRIAKTTIISWRTHGTPSTNHGRVEITIIAMRVFPLPNTAGQCDIHCHIEMPSKLDSGLPWPSRCVCVCAREWNFAS